MWSSSVSTRDSTRSECHRTACDLGIIWLDQVLARNNRRNCKQRHRRANPRSTDNQVGDLPAEWPRRMPVTQPLCTHSHTSALSVEKKSAWRYGWCGQAAFLDMVAYSGYKQLLHFNTHVALVHPLLLFDLPTDLSSSFFFCVIHEHEHCDSA